MWTHSRERQTDRVLWAGTVDTGLGPEPGSRGVLLPSVWCPSGGKRSVCQAGTAKAGVLAVGFRQTPRHLMVAPLAD